MKIEENTDLVFSKRADGLISVAQQRFSVVHGRRQGLWIKNAIIVDKWGLQEAANGFVAALEALLAEEEEGSGKVDGPVTGLHPN